MIRLRDGDKPLYGRVPTHAEWRLLERLALDMKDHIDANDLKLIRDISQKRDFSRYQELSDYWGLQSINPSVQVVGVRDACLYQLSAFLQKWSRSETISDAQKDKALDKFYMYERSMREYNRESYRDLTWSNDPQVNLWFSRMQTFIKDVLGPLDFEKVTRYARPGPGGTFGQSSQLGHRFYKYASLPYEVTSNCIVHARRFIKQDKRWLRALQETTPNNNGVSYWRPLLADSALFQVVPGNRIEFVPKKEDEARTIGLEPSMNVMLQLGVDGYIRKRLLQVGININDQEINQKLAQSGSIDNLLSTLDLAGASDNISMRLVEKALPYEWVSYLYDLRSDVGFLPDGSSIRYEKLSSMGNGYTFAVETLIFAACIFAVKPDVVFGSDAHAYGDDLIIPTTHVDELIKMLNLCGFLVNTEKSFYQETFTRESCGKDFYRGENIRPIFLKNNLESLGVFAFYSLHNGLAEWFSRILHIPIDQLSSLTFLREGCSEKWLLFGPPDLENQSSYLASALGSATSPRPQRLPTGLYLHDRAVARVKKDKIRGYLGYFTLMCHMLRPEVVADSYISETSKKLLAGGSQFDVTRRSGYNIVPQHRRGRAQAWPVQHHEL